jgi:hypothetical protein
MSRLALLLLLVAACKSKSPSESPAGSAGAAGSAVAVGSAAVGAAPGSAAGAAAAGSAVTAAETGSGAGSSDAPAGPPPAIDPSKFDRACAAATDCVVVKPAMCDPCGCANAAIASKAMMAFDEQANKLACPPPDLKLHCEPCKAYVAACEAGSCVAKPR